MLKRSSYVEMYVLLTAFSFFKGRKGLKMMEKTFSGIKFRLIIRVESKNVEKGSGLLVSEQVKLIM